MRVRQSKHLMEYTIIFDLETTGFRGMPQMSDNHKIVQASFYCLETEKTFDSFVDPEMLIPPWSTKVHSVTNENVSMAPNFKQMFGQFIEKLGIEDDSRIMFIAHNCYGFDRNVLMKELINNKVDVSKYTITFWDTLPWLRKHYAHIEKNSKTKRVFNLTYLYEYFFNEKLENAHSSDADVRALVRIYKKFIEPNIDTFEERPTFIELECFGSLRFIGPYRAKLLTQKTDTYNVTDLRKFIKQKLLFQDKYWVDDFIKYKIGIRDFHQRMHVLSILMDLDIWDRNVIDNMRRYDNDTMSDLDYYIKYKYRECCKPKNYGKYIRGLFEIKNNYF